MAIVEKLQDVIDYFEQSPAEKKTSIKKAMAYQFRPCFDAFCWKHRLHDEWKLYIQAISSSPNGNNSELKSAIGEIFDNHTDQMEEMELPAFTSLSLASYLIDSEDSAFKNATGAFFHELGFANSCLVSQSRDFDWVDPSIELHPVAKRYLHHYILFISGKTSEEELLAASEYYDIRWLNQQLPAIEEMASTE